MLQQISLARNVSVVCCCACDVMDLSGVICVADSDVILL